MKRLAQILPIFLAAALQIMPMVRNFFLSPAAGSSFAFILRWGVGSAAAVGAYDSCSGATNFFAGPTNMTLNMNTPYTTNLLLTVKTSGDGGALCTVLTNSTVAAVLIYPATTTNGMPAGMSLKFFDLNTGSSSFSNVYCQIYGTPTKAGTNLFHLNLFYQTGTAAVDGDFRIVVQAASGGVAPTITNQPTGTSIIAGGSTSFSVTAGGTTPLAYQWRLANTNLTGNTASALSLSQVRMSQAGNYTVVITNSFGSITSSPAALVVNAPASPTITAPTKNGGGFQFTFVPVVGLTNTVQANSDLRGGAWNMFSNVPPPVSVSPVTVTDTLGSSNRFYRVMIQP